MTDSIRQPLLTQKGRLTDPCWAVDDIFEYNKENIHLPFRRREWEFYQVFNEHFAFQVFYDHGPGGGRVGATLVDFDTEERVTCGKRQLFCGDSLDLDFSFSEPHTLKFEDKELFLSIGFDGRMRQLIVRSDRFDVELCGLCDTEAMAAAIPFARKSCFLYQYRMIFPHFSGHVHMHKLDYPLGEGTVMALSSGRGVLPYQSTRIWAAGGIQTGDGYLALNLGEDYGPESAPTENAVFLDGVMDKLGRVNFKFKSENLMRIWRISDTDRRVHLEFTPEFDNYEKAFTLVSDIRRHQLYGRLNGSVRLADRRVIKIENARFFIEHCGERR